MRRANNINPIINFPFDDAKRLGAPTLDEAGFKQIIGEVRTHGTI